MADQFNVYTMSIAVPLEGNASMTVTVVSGDTVYYGDNQNVSPTSNQGSLTAGGSATFTQQTWLRSASFSAISVVRTTGVAGGDLSGTYPNPVVSRVLGVAPGAANGVATLDGTTHLPSSQLPASALTAPNHYDLGKDAFGNMAIGSGLYSVQPGAVPSHAGYNVAVGRNALINLTQGSYNTALGDSALSNFTTANYGVEAAGGENVAVGQGASGSLVDGYWTVAVGRNALNAAVHDVATTAIGWGALSLTNAGVNLGYNTACGHEAGQWITTGQGNTAVGAAALTGTNTAITGSANTAVGQYAMQAAQGAPANNVAIGGSSLYNLTTGSNNSIVGQNAGGSIVTGNYNVALGQSAGPSGDFSFTVCIGRNTSASQWGGVAIGTDSTGAAATAAQDVFALGTATHRVKVSNNATGTGSAALGANCPAVTPTAPYTWLRMMSNDGSVVFVPAWK